MFVFLSLFLILSRNTWIFYFLLKAFSNYSFLLNNSNNYYLVFFLLEILNNMIQYQFDGNCNLVYTIIRKRQIFFNLLNLPTDTDTIDQIYDKQMVKNKEKFKNDFSKSMEGAIPAKEAEPGTLKTSLAETPSVLNMTEKTVSSTLNKDQLESNTPTANNTAPGKAPTNDDTSNAAYNFYQDNNQPTTSISSLNLMGSEHLSDHTATNSTSEIVSISKSDIGDKLNKSSSSSNSATNAWKPTGEWVSGWKSKLPLQTIMRLLQVLVPQVEKICIDKGLTDESEILKFLQNGTLVGLLPVPHPILIRKYQPNYGTIMWFRTYMWGVIYLRYFEFNFF